MCRLDRVADLVERCGVLTAAFLAEVGLTDAGGARADPRPETSLTTAATAPATAPIGMPTIPAVMAMAWTIGVPITGIRPNTFSARAPAPKNPTRNPEPAPATTLPT